VLWCLLQPNIQAVVVRDIAPNALSITVPTPSYHDSCMYACAHSSGRRQGYQPRCYISLLFALRSSSRYAVSGTHLSPYPLFGVPSGLFKVFLSAFCKHSLFPPVLPCLPRQCQLKLSVACPSWLCCVASSCAVLHVPVPGLPNHVGRRSGCVPVAVEGTEAGEAAGGLAACGTCVSLFYALPNPGFHFWDAFKNPWWGRPWPCVSCPK
jgi:hypothetical protein